MFEGKICSLRRAFTSCQHSNSASDIIIGGSIKDPGVYCRYPVFIRDRRTHMARNAKDEEREERINMEIIVDAYGPEEQAAGWYNYLDDTLQFPFSALCIARRGTSPVEPRDEVEVVGLAPDEECQHESFVLV